MFICINNDEEKFLVLDSKDGVCEWTSIRDCRKYLEMGVKIQGLTLKSIDKVHKYLDYMPIKNFIPSSIISEVSSTSSSSQELLKIIKRYILSGNNILQLRSNCHSYSIFVNELRRWYSGY